MQVRAPQALPRSQFCVFNFFFWTSWLAGGGDYLLQKKKLKMEFCGCSDTRRAFSRACIAKSAYHKPSLSRRMGGWALRCRGAHAVPPRGAALAAVGRRGPGGTGRARLRRLNAGKRGSHLSWRYLIPEYKMPLAFCVFEVRLSEIRDQVRGPKARMRSILSSELASSGPRWRWTALRAD